MYLEGYPPHGPFLKLPEEKWPKKSHPTTIPVEVDQSERRKIQPVLQLTESSKVTPWKKFSNSRKLPRVTAYVVRFINKLRMKYRMKENTELSRAVDTTEPKPVSTKELKYWINHLVIKIFFFC